MTTEALKSTAITNMDASPPLYPTSGEGGVGFLQSVVGQVTPTSGKTTGSTYQMVRVPTTAKIRKVAYWWDGAQTTVAGEFGVYYSDNTQDGTPPALAGTAVAAAFFAASGTDIHAAVEPTDTTYANAATASMNVGANANIPLWKALGLTANPGGFFDIVFTQTDTSSLTTGGNLNVEVQYVGNA